LRFFAQQAEQVIHDMCWTTRRREHENSLIECPSSVRQHCPEAQGDRTDCVMRGTFQLLNVRLDTLAFSRAAV